MIRADVPPWISARRANLSPFDLAPNLNATTADDRKQFSAQQQVHIWKRGGSADEKGKCQSELNKI